MLTMAPILKEQFQLEKKGEAGEDVSTLIIPRTGWLERLSIRWLKQPTAIRVQLDVIGSFVLSRCTGKMTVEDLANALEEQFGEKAEPVLPRLVKYLEIIESNGWIRMRSTETE
ncbi:PqqD family protein [Marininema mesophilum]|nr:PqqD family protein [Marininema mesophilum]